MSRRGVIFDKDSADRIAKVVTEAERNRAGASGRMRGVQPNEKQVVEVISQHDATPMYLGQAKVFVAKYRQYEDHEQCFIMEASRDDLVVGRRYPARRVGDYGGRPLYLTHCCGEDPAPPDPECDYCEGETPVAWDLTLEDFSGDCSSLNGQYQLDWTEDGCNWVYAEEGLLVRLEATASEYVLTITDGTEESDLEIVYRKERANSKCCGPVGMTLDSSTCEGAPESQQVLAPACQDPAECWWCYDDPEGGINGPVLLFDDLPETVYLLACGLGPTRLAPECFATWSGVIPLHKYPDGGCGWTGTVGSTTSGQCGIRVDVFLWPTGCFVATGHAYLPVHPPNSSGSIQLFGNTLPHPNWLKVLNSPTNWEPRSGSIETNPLVVRWPAGDQGQVPALVLYEEFPESVNCCGGCAGNLQLLNWTIDPGLESAICDISIAGWELLWWGPLDSGCLWGYDSQYAGTGAGSATLRLDLDGYLILEVGVPWGSVGYRSASTVSDTICCGSTDGIILDLDFNTCPGSPPETITVFRGLCTGEEPPPDPVGDPCEECTEGDTPSSWSLILADLTGDCTALNDVHTLVQDDPCEWKASSSGFSFTLENTDAKTILTITDGDANVGVWEGVTTEDCCEPIELTQESGSGCLDGVGTLVLVPSCYVPAGCEWCSDIDPDTRTLAMAGFTEACDVFNDPFQVLTKSFEGGCTWTKNLGDGNWLRLEAFEGSLTLDGFMGVTQMFSYSNLSWDGNCNAPTVLDLAFSMCDDQPASLTLNIQAP